MNLKGVYSNSAFTRNPVVITEDISPEQGEGRYTVRVGGEQVFEGRFFPPLNVDISEVVDAHIPYFPERLNTGAVIAEIEDAGEVADREVDIWIECGDYETETKFFGVPGGISRQNFKRMAALKTDVFKSRFFNAKNNFFLTTRTASWRIVMKETELYPLYFFCDHSVFQSISARESVSGTGLDFGVYGSVNILDVAQLRRKFYNESRVLPSVIDIYTDGRDFVCRIVVERADASKERYRLKFRNSLGVFEIIELTGELSITPDYSESEEASFKRYESITGSFYADRERVERKQSVTVETGVKRPDEVRFLMDMIGSEEVYLLDLASFPVKVIPSVENFTYRTRPETPEKFTLKLEIADSETNIMQEIIDGSEGRKPRVFSKQFSKQFN